MKKIMLVLLILISIIGCTANPEAIRNRIKVIHQHDKFIGLDKYETTPFSAYFKMRGAFFSPKDANENVEVSFLKGKMENLGEQYLIRFWINRTGEDIDWIFPKNLNSIVFIDDIKYELKIMKVLKGDVTHNIAGEMVLTEEILYFIDKNFLEALKNIQHSFEFKIYGENNSIECVKEKNPLDEYKKISIVTSAEKILELN